MCSVRKSVFTRGGGGLILLLAPFSMAFDECGKVDPIEPGYGYYNCAGDEMITGDHVGYGNYEDTTASSGPEVQCTYTHGESESAAMAVLEMVGFDNEPKSVAIDVPHVGGGAKNPIAGSSHVDGSDWFADYSSALPSDNRDYSGVWLGYLSEVQADGTEADETTYNAGFYYEYAGSKSSAAGADVYSEFGSPATWSGTFELAPHPSQSHSAEGVRMFPILLDGTLGMGPITTITVVDPGDGDTLYFNGTAHTLTASGTITLYNAHLGKPFYVVMDPAGDGDTPELQISGTTPTGWTPFSPIGAAYTLPTGLATVLSAYTGDQPWVVRDTLKGIHLEAVGSGYTIGARYTDTSRTDFELALSGGWTVQGEVLNRNATSMTVDIDSVSGFPTNAVTGTWTFSKIQ